jgi:hypothetical protein
MLTSFIEIMIQEKRMYKISLHIGEIEYSDTKI